MAKKQDYTSALRQVLSLSYEQKKGLDFQVNKRASVFPVLSLRHPDVSSKILP